MTISIKPGQAWDLDLFQPEDAEGVARLFRTVYGNDYSIKIYLDPDGLREENQAGRIISSVARTPEGDIIGHTALFRSAPYEKLYESGASAVLPEYRGEAIFSRMIRHSLDFGTKVMGVEAIMGESVCNHLFTQRLSAGIGFFSCAVAVDLMPAEFYAKEKSASGRVAALSDFKTMVPRPQTLYIPKQYVEDLRFIYKDFDDERNLIASESPIPIGKLSILEGQYFPFARVLRIAVLDAGEDLADIICEEQRKYDADGLNVTQVWLNLSQPWTGEAANRLFSQGFFLGGVLPRWFNDDALMLQKVAGTPNWEGIHLLTDRSRALVHMVRQDWKRAMAI